MFSLSFIGLSKPDIIKPVDTSSPIFEENTNEKICEKNHNTIIWHNGFPSDNWILILSQFDEVFPFNAQVADDFIFMKNDTVIYGVNWWGNFWGVGEPVNPVDFNIFFYADDGSGFSPTGGGMDNPETTALATYFIQDVIGVNDSGHRLYSAALPTPFIASKGEKYWIVVQAVFEILPKWGRVTNNGTVHLASAVFGCPQLGESFWTDLEYGDVAWYLIGGINKPPSSPKVFCPKRGKPGETITFTFNSRDLDGDDVRFHIDWGDGQNYTSTYTQSGNNVSESHVWSDKGTFIITIMAEDYYGGLSNATIIKFVIGKNKSFNKPIYQYLNNPLILSSFPQKTNFIFV